MVERHRTRVVEVGGLPIGGDSPIRVQSMTTTNTADVEATVEQVRRLEEAGCELVRVAVPTRRDAAVLGEIKRRIRIPLIADIHFDHRMAFRAMEQGVDKIRINPGNVGGEDRFREVVREARDRGVPMRVGVNSGSVEKDLLEKHGWPSAQAMVESALRQVAVCEEMGYRDVIVSIKSSTVEEMVEANRLLGRQTDCPLHLGVTEAGSPGYGSLKSAVGIGAVLLDGLGDTIRVSLVGDPVLEIPVAYDILKCTGRRATSPEVVACPTCGRIKLVMEPIVEEVTRRLKEEGIREPMRISILGCVVNGPGEAAQSDIGVAGGGGKGVVYRKGVMVRTVPEDGLVEAVMAEARALVAERAAAAGAAAAAN